MRRFTRHSLTVTAVAALAAALSGCVLIESQSSSQQGPLGGVQIATTACASDKDSDNSGYSPPDTNCQGSSKGGNSDGDAVDGSNQFLLGYRIPTASVAPATITTTSPGGGSAFTFTQNSYTTHLQTLSPAPSGEQWVGYLSSAQSYTQAATQRFTVSPTFALRQGSDGSAFAGPFNYRVVVGFRSIDGSYPASRPVTCGSTLTSGYNSDGLGDCADSPSPATIATDAQQPTADLGILDAPGPVSVNQGKIARVGFVADYAGDGNPAPDFDLSASTDVPAPRRCPARRP